MEDERQKNATRNKSRFIPKVSASSERSGGGSRAICRSQGPERHETRQMVALIETIPVVLRRVYPKGQTK